MICPTCQHDNLPGSEQCSNCQADLTQLDQPTAQDRVEHSLMTDPVSVLPPRQPITVSPTASVGQALETMLTHNIGALLIVDRTGQLVGIFSERDLLTKVAGTEDYADRAVEEYMTPNPETVQSTHTLAFALHKMDIGGYRHLPVVRDGQPLGMISVHDMLRYITRLCKCP